jgi:hypothetical protein
MPPLPPIANTVKVVFFYNNLPATGSNQAANIMHVQHATPLTYTAAQLSTLATGAMTWWGTHFKALITSNWQLNNVLATAVDGTGTQGASTGAVIPGTGTPPTYAPSTAVCISWLGAPSYRGGKPRTYLPGIPTNSTVLESASSLTPAYALSVKNAAVAAIADMTWAAIGTVNAALGAVSYVKGKTSTGKPVYRPTPLFWPYVGANCHQRLDSQRRRSGKESKFGIS